MTQIFVVVFSVSNFKCLECRDHDKDKEKQLKKVWRGSKRKCTCRDKRLVHKEKCPMYPGRLGERPYEGDDVMTREDSEWLDKRLRKK